MAPILESYLQIFREQPVDALILGCTHYIALKEQVRAALPATTVYSQDEIVPTALADYLRRHPEQEQLLDKEGNREYLVTDLTDGYQELATRLSGQPITLQEAAL